MVNERTFYKMNKLKNGISASKKDAEEREENHLDRILDSSVCRKILPWAMPQRSDASLKAYDQLLSERQKRRWNFDFLTETPLPGRYEWIRTDCSNGHDQKDTSRSTIRNGEVKNRSTPYVRKSRPPQKPEERSSRSTRSCDRSLDRPRRSERNAQVRHLNKAPTTV